MGKLPVVSGKELIQILEAHGFEMVRQRGSHVSLRKTTDDGTWKTVVPLHDTLARGTLMDILRQAGLSREDLGV
jgi:predicted RNA binding protein YcfA (HicA-like mRNA interferase family)